jgi:MFS family permease
MVSLQNIGAFFAALGISLVSARFGRKRTIMASCAVFILGVILQVIPSHALPCFYVGRFVSGLGLGAATAVAPSYNAEMAPKEIRGQLGSGMQWLFALGVMISYWIDYGVAVGMAESSAQWQIPVGLQMVPAAVLGFGLIGFPESVRWLVKKERYDEAWESLSWMRADTGMFCWWRSDGIQGLMLICCCAAGPEVKAEFAEIRAGIAEEMRASEGFQSRELLEPANKKRLALAFGIFLGQQSTGMTALAYFAPQFL